MSAVAASVPERLWRNRMFLRAMGAVAGPVLGAGHIGLTGRVPNGQTFGARPRRMWFVRESTAHLKGHSLGQVAGLPVQDRLGDFWIPQRGIFMIGSSGSSPSTPPRSGAGTFDPSPSAAGPDTLNHGQHLYPAVSYTHLTLPTN